MFPGAESLGVRLRTPRFNSQQNQLETILQRPNKSSPNMHIIIHIY